MLLVLLVPRLSRNLQHSAEFTGTFFSKKRFSTTFYFLPFHANAIFYSRKSNPPLKAMTQRVGSKVLNKNKNNNEK